MKRRYFFATSLWGGFGAIRTFSSESPGQAENEREFYELRKYHIYPGSQGEKNQRFYTFLKDVAIPALNRNSINPVGVFTPYHGSNIRELFVLLPHNSIESVVTLNNKLFSDDVFLKDGAAVINSTLSDPVHLGMKNSQMLAYPDYKTLEEGSIKFWNDPEWAAMRNLPEHQDIVSNDNSLMLRPTGYSQI